MSADSTEPVTPHWSALAQRWKLTGSPLRPTPPDLAGYARLAREWTDRHGAPRVLLLGVTPELYRLPWPAGRDFIAVDHTRAMLDHVWPGTAAEAMQASWLDLPLPTASRDLAVCDGGLHLLDHPRSQQQLIARLHDVVTPGGRCIFRFFALPAERETPAHVLADLLAGRIANLNVLKLRLGMALQESSSAGVELATVWRTLRAITPDWETLAATLGWPVDHLRVIDTYRDSTARYYFLTRAEAEALFRAGGFARCGEHVSDYALGERCPILSFERR